LGADLDPGHSGTALGAGNAVDACLDESNMAGSICVTELYLPTPGVSVVQIFLLGSLL
jgi:hypothetical protein